jgi:hypothetical protein
MLANATIASVSAIALPADAEMWRYVTDDVWTVPQRGREWKVPHIQETWLVPNAGKIWTVPHVEESWTVPERGTIWSVQ